MNEGTESGHLQVIREYSIKVIYKTSEPQRQLSLEVVAVDKNQDAVRI